LAIWPEHWDAVRLFCACADQWTWLVLPTPGGAPQLVRERLPNSELLATARMMGLPESSWPKLLDQVSIMRDEAASIFRSR